MTKINMEELLADRETGGRGPFTDNKPMLVRHSPIAHANYETAEGSANTRRLHRLPDLEAAYIEAVELLRELMDTGAWDLNSPALEHARKFLEQSA